MTADTPSDLDQRVRTAVYRRFVETTAAPTVSDIARELNLDSSAIRASYQRLFGRRVLVLAADAETILMAPPFSGVPTQHRVHVGAREYVATCAWDALGIPAALHQAGVVRSRCEQTLESLEIHVDERGPAAVPCVIHFAVPAAHWWDNIVYT
jgi:hypothetical protein